MNKIIITKNNGNVNHAGSKARDDVEEILRRKGYHEVTTSIALKNRIIRKMIERIRYFKVCHFSEDSVIVHQYPNLPFEFNACLGLSKKKNNFKLITIIHDISVRANGTRNNNIYLQKYIFKISDCLIVHNETMKGYLVEKFGLHNDKIVTLKIFDYLLKDNSIKNDILKNGNIIIAGNLDKNKSGYVYKLKNISCNIKYNVYGPNFDESIIQHNVKYMGSYSPEELPNHLRGSWGLIWDGPEIETCAGQMGQYLKLNNPHKTSLYIACGIPVIVWREAAIANFIKEMGLGITVESICDIEGVISNISEQEYSSMRKRVLECRNRLIDGYYMSGAVDKAYDMVLR